MTVWLITLIEKFGYAAIFLLITLENVFPPIPSEVILTFSGFLTTRTDLQWGLAILAATVGSILGAVILYVIGRQLPPERLSQWLAHPWARRLGFKPQDVDKAQQWFERYGTAAIFYGRCIPIVRSLVSLPAGMARTSWPRFLIYTAAGSFIWNSVLISLGQMLGQSWEQAAVWIETYSLVVVLLGLVVVLIVAWRWWRRRSKSW